jgi:hypothetical protein
MEQVAQFEMKDGGARMQYGDMVREPNAGRTDYSLVYDGPMLERWAILLTKGALKYKARNWMLASDRAALDRFRESAARHFYQWMAGHTDEDHAAAVMFNINGFEYLLDKLGDDQIKGVK